MIMTTPVTSLRACGHCGTAPGSFHGPGCIIGLLEAPSDPDRLGQPCSEHDKRDCYVCASPHASGQDYRACRDAYPGTSHGPDGICRTKSFR
jgi:hypothetical protein